jgi:hypothetical protein
MAAENEGIMSLPQGNESAAAPQISLDDAYGAIRGGLEDVSPEVATDMQGALNEIMPMLDELEDDQLDMLIEVFQYILDRPDEYAENVKQLAESDLIDPGMLPDEYDPEILSAILVVFVEARRQRQMGNQRAAVAEVPMPPAQMARGGIAEAARLVASKGRYGDTMLAHITPEEARLLKSRGGSGTINPETGQPEFLKKLVKKIGNVITGTAKGIGKAISNTVKGVVNVAKKIVKSPIGRIVATVALAAFLGPGAFGFAGAGLSAGASAAIASGTVTAIGGGNAKDILRSAAVGFLGAPGGPVANYVGRTIGAGAMGVTNAAAASAINAGLVSTGVGLLSGQNLADAVKSGLVSGAISGSVTGFQQGFGAQVPKPMTVPMPLGGSPAGQAPGTSPTGLMSPVESLDFGGTPPANLFMPDRPEGIANYPQVMAYRAAQEGDFSRVARLQETYGDRITGRYIPGAGATTPGAPAAVAAPGASQTALDQIYGDIAQRGAPGAVAAPGAPAPGTPGTPGGPRPVPGVMSSLGRMGGGISNILQGNVRQGFGELASGSKDLFLPGSSTPAELRGTSEYTSAVARGATDAAALAEAGKTYNPSIIRSYGPGLAAGLGIMGMSGGFTPKQLPESELAQQLRGTPGEDLIAARPSQYIPQGLPGIQYGPSGEIIGSSPYYSPRTMEDVRVSTPGIMPQGMGGPMYQAPQYAMGAGQMVPQPYNTSAMYSNPFFNPYLGMPMRAADGGIASLEKGGYPRRTGQISGPGTETSDSIPAMLSDGEFVMTAKAVRGAGKGNRRAGAKKMYALMHQLERNASRG